MKSILIHLVAALMALPAIAQEGAKASGVIGHLDTVEVTVFREDDLTTRGQLSPDGTLNMPLIGTVKLVGLTTNQAAAAIEAKLKDGYLIRPQVSVSIGARLRRTITVLGQAQNPGVFELPVNRSLTVVEAVGLAGGVTRIANSKKITLKRGKSGEVQQVDLKAITSGKSKDIPLRDGDVLTIPESLF
jgi:protein involved in polysaccharide export with SLBB domain